MCRASATMYFETCNQLTATFHRHQEPPPFASLKVRHAALGRTWEPCAEHCPLTPCLEHCMPDRLRAHEGGVGVSLARADFSQD